MSKYWINLSKDSYVGHGLVEVNTVINNKYMIRCYDVISCRYMDCDHCILNFNTFNDALKQVYIKHRIEQEI